MTGQEESIRQRIETKLQRNGMLQARTFIPKRHLKERKEGIWYDVFKVMFPGYILLATEQIEDVAKLLVTTEGVVRFLQNDKEFQEIRIEEIAKLLYMADADGVIGVSKVRVNADDSVEVVSGPLKGCDDWITKRKRCKDRVAIDVTLGEERREIWLTVEFVDEAVTAAACAA
jgi:transcriptional antiterminator NusG